MSEPPDSPRNDDDLESLLRRLVPTRLDVHQVSELNRTRERLTVQNDRSTSRIPWSRAVPLALLCTVAMFGFGLYRYGIPKPHNANDGKAAIAATEAHAAPALPSVSEEAIPQARFLPVSTYGTVVNTSAGGVIQTESGPRQRLSVEYGDAYHWHDPETGTNVRLFSPRSEEFVVPLQTD
ncbi:MAG TPA: hypothetical protein PLA50_04990 [Bacteroidia bacterium]|nr:hypothetical protein [Bacteroidia bacterium]